MKRLTISDFKRAILDQHGAKARIVGAETAILRGAGDAPEDLLVLIFAFLDHPTARRCYAWEADGGAIVVLHGGSVDSPQAAVGSVLAPRLRAVEPPRAVSVTWSFRSSIGVLRIRPSRQRAGRFELWLDDLSIGSYQSPEIAADDVAMATTGGPRGLDEILHSEAPGELSEWTRHEREQ